MNILFVYTNINGSHKDCYSIGLSSIISATRNERHNVRLVIVKTKEEYGKVLAQMQEFKPALVGFSSVSSQFSFVKEIADLIKKKYPGVLTVCGGVHPTILPECILEADCLDGIFVGESEDSFTEFLRKIENNRPYKDTENLAYVENNKLIRNKLKPLKKNIDSLPYPDKEISPFEDNIRITGHAPFSFARGCPYLCSYCSNHAIANAYNLSSNQTRYRSPESSIREIEEAVSRFPIEKIFIQDDIFGLDEKWRKEFCEKYRERIGLDFICLLRVNFIDEEFIRLLKTAGCYRVLIGIESGNEYIRTKVMNRKMSNIQIINAFRIIERCRLQSNAINIIGIPGESEDMLWDTIRLNRKIRPAMSSANIFYPYKGTKLGDQCFSQGLVDENLYDSFSSERRETVLNYPKEYKAKLIDYAANWEKYVYPFDLRRHLLRFAKRKFFWKYLSAAKKLISLSYKKARPGKKSKAA